MTPLLQVSGLHVAVDGTEILRGVNLEVGEGELHALMGPNGSGKSTLAHTLLGNAVYRVTSGAIRLRGEDVTAWPPDVRAKAGMFLA
ncbi:MAG TPA: ATP-binding cassette domain-containing protein, partial [Acidimicrobiales bacterium]|nr:ATP-binding cassette domain-containing protein [Acidimicrobiales bacterium]